MISNHTWLKPSFYLYAFQSDGSKKAGYPVTLYTMPSNTYEMFGPPVPADLDEDGDLEILLGYNHSGLSYARCYHHDGSPCTGFPIQIATSSQLFYLGLGDVTGDWKPEPIALENHLSGNYRAFVIDLVTGTLLPGGMATLPLNWDVFTNTIISLINSPIFFDFMGKLDGSGDGAALFDTLGPLPSGSTGIVLHFAFALKPWNFASDPVKVDIVP